MAQILQFPQYVQKRFSSGRAAFDILKVFKSKSELGTIYIDLNAGLTGIKSADDLAKYAMLRTFAHEFTHFIEK